MRMFTKIAVTAASGALPFLLWAGAASAQQSQDNGFGQSQSQSQSTVAPPASFPSTSGTGGSGGTLARTGADDLLPLALGGTAVAGAIVLYGVRRRSVI